MLLLALLPSALAADANLLFVGNSYTFFNDLDQLTAGLFDAAEPADDHVALRLSEGGYTLPMHLAQADGTMGDTEWSEALVTGSTDWDWVVLQDQSQVPGFPTDNADYLASLTALPPLDAMIEAKHGVAVLFMTWGRLNGDVDNPDLYPDYSTMQAHLVEGYTAYAAAVTTPDRTAYVAPVGLAWQHIYAADVASGADPTQPGTLFYALYYEDGSHPSPLGSYLAACVIYATVSGNDPTGLPAPDTVPTEAVAQLQEAARATVFDETPGYAYPWQSDDTGSPDTGGDTGQDSADDSDDDSDDDSAPDDSAGDDASAPISGGACGCASGVTPGTALPLLAALGLGRRRRAPTSSRR